MKSKHAHVRIWQNCCILRPPQDSLYSTFCWTDKPQNSVKIEIMIQQWKPTASRNNGIVKEGRGDGIGRIRDAGSETLLMLDWKHCQDISYLTSIKRKSLWYYISMSFSQSSKCVLEPWASLSSKWIISIRWTKNIIWGNDLQPSNGYKESSIQSQCYRK